MKLKSLYLRNFRNIREAEVFFSDQVNVICGDNAQGKTNLLEAIFLIATGKTFRAQKLQELIRDQETFFYLEAHIENEKISHEIKLSSDGIKRRLQIDANQYETFTPLLGGLPIVLYSPKDLELIGGAPELRRRFLNLHLSQSDPLYVHHLQRYFRALKQRNLLLKKRNSESALACFEEEMAKSAAYLTQERGFFVEELKGLFAKESSEISSPMEIHEMRFHPSFSPNYLETLQENRSREKELGFTLIGPHRDDLSFWIEQKSSKLFASEGQKKTAIAALHLAEWERMRRKTPEMPILAIDDLDLALDNTRQTLLRKKLKTLSQTFVTTPKAPQEEHGIYLMNGSIVSRPTPD